VGKSTPQAPTPPDPVALANAQGAANKDTAITQAQLNAVNQNTPWGTVTYTQTQTPGTGTQHWDDATGQMVSDNNGTPQFTQNVSLSPDQQDLYNKQVGIEKQAYGTAGQALNNVQDVLSSKLNFGGGGDMPLYDGGSDGIPSLVTNINGGTPQSGFGTVSPLFGIASGGNIQTGIGDAGGIQNNLSSTGQQTNLGYSNPIQTSFAPGGPLAGNVSPTGQQTGLGNAGSIQGQINTNGLPSTPLTANDFAAQGDATTNALMQRFNQDWARQQENTQAQLNAQGIQQGSAGYDTAMDTLNRARNDAQAQAYLAGNQEQNTLFNQALAANQNAFGQRQAQGTFANNAQGQQFGQNLQGGQFANDALNNLLQQQLATGQFQNATAGQQYNQNQGAAAFGNAAQQQGYNQALGSGQFTNQALQNQFGQNQASQAAQNAAQQQLYAQLLGGGQFANQAQAQQFGQNSAQQQAFNQAAQQQTGNNQALASFYNTAQGQAFSQAQANAALQNQARQQAINEQILQRSQPINEIATLLGLGGGIQVPQGAPNFGVNIAPTDVLGAYGLNQQAQQNNYNAQLQANNAMWGGLGNLAGTLGSAAILASDARLKTNIRLAGHTANGTPLYLYSYKNKPETEIVGVMAQDMMMIDPLAVHERNGFYAVDYARVA
jgi:hypothetical protein